MIEPETNQQRRITMATTTLNAGARKTLASQLDRLDTILDGLADNLNEAVAVAAADCMKEIVNVAVQEAVHAALVEVLSNAELRKRLANPADGQPTAIRLVRSCWAWVVGTAKEIWNKIVAVTYMAGDRLKEKGGPLVAAAGAKARQAGKEIARRARGGWMLVAALAALAKRFRTQLLVALGIGVLVGAVCYFAGREVASLGCGLAGFAGSLASGAVNRLRRILPFVVGSEP
jgi:hypothetical protein